MPNDSSTYHSGMLDIKSRSGILKENLGDSEAFLIGVLQTLFSLESG